MSVRVVMLLMILLAACGPEVAGDTTAPPPATEAEIEVFCARHEKLRDLDYGSKFMALLEVAPTELTGPLTRMVNNPGRTDDDALVEEFIVTHCEQ